MPLRNDPMCYSSHMLENLPVMVTMIDMRALEVIYTNRQARGIFGEVVGGTCWKVLQRAQDGPCAFCNIKRLLDPNASPSGTCRQQVKHTLTRRWYDITDSALPIDDGRMVKMSVAIDITDQRQSGPSDSKRTAGSSNQDAPPEEVLVMCARCHKVRNRGGEWQSIAHYMTETMGIPISHGMCRSCGELLYPEFKMGQGYR